MSPSLFYCDAGGGRLTLNAKNLTQLTKTSMRSIALFLIEIGELAEELALLLYLRKEQSR